MATVSNKCTSNPRRLEGFLESGDSFVPAVHSKIDLFYVSKA